MLIGSVITTFTNPVIAAFFDVMQAQKLLMLLSTTGLALTQLGMLLPGLGYRGMLVLCTLHSVIGAHNFPTFDASTTAVCPSRYGDIRLFGSAAFGVAAFGGGGLISLAGNAPARSTFSLAFILASALQLVSLPLITRIDFSALHASKKQTASTEATDATMAREKPTGISALIRMAADPKMLYFMVIVFLSGWQMSIIDTFFTVHLSNMNASGMLMGTARLLTTVAELPAFRMSAKILKALGVSGSFAVAQLACEWSTPHALASLILLIPADIC